jgi:4a-hydroxytetrahydrobiopterin dehydratase
MVYQAADRDFGRIPEAAFGVRVARIKTGGDHGGTSVGGGKEIGAGGTSGWSETAGREAIGRTFTFKDFNEASGFWSAPLVAEKNDHHPEWKNVYKTVDVALATHDAGGVTRLDIDLAKAMMRSPANWARPECRRDLAAVADIPSS